MGPGDLEIWLNHFEYHALHLRRVPHGLTDVLRTDELQLIASSIATFQLGEQSEGRTFLRAAERFERARQTPHLVRIIELLIREEQGHASLLQAFMQDHGMPLKRTDWTDRVFRQVRRLAGLELYLSALISAELIGNVYYRALESVTDCERLRVLCRGIVSDELAHVGFESQLLSALRAGHGAPLRALTRSAHRTLFAGTAAVVWLTHRSVLRRAGHSARSFLRSCQAQYIFYLEPAGQGRRICFSCDDVVHPAR
jgi:rubrerythrin